MPAIFFTCKQHRTFLSWIRSCAYLNYQVINRPPHLEYLHRDYHPHLFPHLSPMSFVPTSVSSAIWISSANNISSSVHSFGPIILERAFFKWRWTIVCARTVVSRVRGSECLYFILKKARLDGTEFAGVWKSLRAIRPRFGLPTCV